MSQLKFVSTTRASLPSMLLVERKKRRRMFPFIVAVHTVLILLDFLPPIQEHYRWIKYVGIYASVTGFDVDDDIRLLVP